MRKGIYVLLIFLAVCFGGLGYMEGREHGREDAYNIVHEELSGELQAAEEETNLGYYKMSLTNVRACILAMDSALIRFMDNPEDSAGIYQFAARAVQCERWWDEAMKWSPNEDEDTYLAEGRFFYDFWKEEINTALEIRIKMLTVENKIMTDGTAEVMNEYAGLDNDLTAQKAELKKFRDRIELYIVASWK